MPSAMPCQSMPPTSQTICPFGERLHPPKKGQQAASFTHSPMYGLRDPAELAITFMKLAHLPMDIATGLDGLMGDASDGTLVSVLSCLQMARLCVDRGAPVMGSSGVSPTLENLVSEVH